MNELLSLRSPSEEKPTFVFATVFILLLTIDMIIMYPHVDTWYNFGSTEQKDWSLEYEDLMLTEQSSITLSDGASETISMEITENFTIDGWMIQRITTLIDYDESALCRVCCLVAVGKVICG